MDSYKILIALIMIGISTAGIIFALDIGRVTVATQDYDIFVDPFKDQQSLFVMGRVTIQNTGSLPLTNVKINFGNGDIQELGTLDPGEKIIVSPPDDNPMEFVVVSTDEGIFVNKAYRVPSKMPGMMGS
jgi:hypothetical protein